MAVQVFFLARDFGECFSENREEENRIVAESVPPSRFFQKNSFRGCGKYAEHFSGFSDGHHAYKSGPPLLALFSMHFAEHFLNALFVRGIRPGIARGMNPRRAAESGHDEPWVIRDHRSLGKPAVVQRFPRRVFRDGWPNFLKDIERIKSGNESKIHGRAGG